MSADIDPTGPRRSPAPMPPRRAFWYGFWAVLIVLMVITLVWLGLAQANRQSEHMMAAAQARFQAFLDAHDGTALSAQFPATARRIDQIVDGAFEPVYANIPRFADHHYSVIGEYTELAYAATGRLEARIGRLLFEGLQERLDAAPPAVRSAFREEFAAIATRWMKEATSGQPGEAQHDIDAAVQLTIADALGRFELEAVSARGVAAGAGGVLTAKAISAAIAKKMLVATATKATGKATAKYATAATASAAAGAVAGSVVLGIGTAVGAAAGGAIAGIVSWFAVDKVIVEGAEYLHRDRFEAELRALVDDNKALVKAELRSMIQVDIGSVRGKTPLELIRER